MAGKGENESGLVHVINSPEIALSWPAQPPVGSRRC